MPASQPPSKIMLIRHGEKPPPEGPPPAGVHEDGTQHDQSLIVRGWQRAGALVGFFTHPWDPAIETPAWIYSPPRKHDDGDHGRPYETATPLAARLNLAPDTSFSLEQEEPLVGDVRTRAGVVLIAWEHKRIPRIANALLGDTTTAPQQWPGDRFDLVWLFDLQPDGRYRFGQRPQLLLHGDRTDLPTSG
jgi:broad specificity phosphatase PhoE